MTLDELRNLDGLGQLNSDHLRAIWYDLRGDWETAHGIVQNMTDTHAMWIHAYLHRKEPDIWNSKYWYGRCGRSYPGDLGFEEEIAIILAELPQQKPLL
jgi:hypothetical protein